eukprot:jgi/Undpi1/8609/HiC_scaffold_25.g11074.m1
MPGQKKKKGGGYGERRVGFMRAMSLAVFQTKLWLCDPLAECRKAGEGRRAAQDELQDMSWVEYQWRANQANRKKMWTPRMNLPPPYLDPQFEVPSRFLQTPVTTPTSSSPPSSPSSDGHGDGAAPEKMPSGGGGGSCVRGFIGVGAGWHHGGRQRVRW